MAAATVKTFHAFCIDEMRRAGLTVPDRPDQTWWETQAAEGLVEALASSETEFDGLVVDEGQDFAKSWIDALELAGAQGLDTPFYIFADEKQDLWPRDWIPDESWPVYDLTVNCRNTEQIAQRIDPISPGSARTLGADGPDSRWSDVPTGTRPEIIVARTVDRLLHQGFAPGELCVLCEDAVLVTRLREMSVRGESFGEFQSGAITVETIGRFKGLEAPAVVVVLGEDSRHPDVEAYVGFSRATTYLHVVAPPSRKKRVPWVD